jgi:hypothetical protein
MLEFVFVILIIVGIFASHWFMEAGFSASTLTQAGLLLLAIGIIEGIPAGFYYHVLLYKTLHPRGQLPIRWWISPQQHHVHLNQEESRRIRRWFFLGGAGFFLCMIGGAVAFIGMWSGPF